MNRVGALGGGCGWVPALLDLVGDLGADSVETGERQFLSILWSQAGVPLSRLSGVGIKSYCNTDWDQDWDMVFYSNNFRRRYMLQVVSYVGPLWPSWSSGQTRVGGS